MTGHNPWALGDRSEACHIENVGADFSAWAELVGSAAAWGLLPYPIIQFSTALTFCISTLVEPLLQRNPLIDPLIQMLGDCAYPGKFGRPNNYICPPE